MDNYHNSSNILNDEDLASMVKSTFNILSSLYEDLKGLGEENNKIKIYKSANDYSIMDITASLNYHKLNNKNEHIYKGKIILSITDRKKNSYLKFFIDKSKTKVLMKSIMEHTFNKSVFSGGFSDYGGTAHQDPSKIKARILRINVTERNQYKFTIYEGKGKMDSDIGSFKMIGEPLKTVERFVPYEEALEMAHEIYDFIRDQELKAVINGKPLYTITDYQESSTDHKVKGHNLDEFKIKNDEYIVQIEPWKGVAIHTISNQELMYILKKTKGIAESTALVLHEQTILEIRKRIKNKQFQ